MKIQRVKLLAGCPPRSPVIRHAWTVLAILILTLAGCAHPAKVRAELEFGNKPPDLTTITVRLKNQEMRPTTPLLVDVSVQLRRGENWGKSASVIHPAAMVLNRQEEQILRSTIKLSGDALRATVTVKDAQSGRVVSTEEFEKILNAGLT